MVVFELYSIIYWLILGIFDNCSEQIG